MCGIINRKQFRFENLEFELLYIKSELISDDLLDTYAELIRSYKEEIFHPIPAPSIELIKKQLRNPVDVFTEYRDFVLMQNNEAIGFISLGYNIGSSNRDILFLAIYLVDRYKNTSLDEYMAKSTLDHVSDEIRIIEFSIRRDQHIYPIFNRLIENGAKSTYTDRLSGSRIRQFSYDEVHNMADKLRSEAKKKGYEIILIENATFEEDRRLNYPKYVAMLEQIWNDMPKEDGSWEDETLTVDEHKKYYKNREILGKTIFTFVALDPDGEPVGMTETAITSGTTVAYQDDTGVIKEHRGNNLGLTLKYQMLDKLLADSRCREVEYWITGNANSNEHMLRINNILKYEELFVRYSHEVSVDKYRAILN